MKDGLFLSTRMKESMFATSNLARWVKSSDEFRYIVYLYSAFCVLLADMLI